jgi:hypothetical protein
MEIPTRALPDVSTLSTVETADFARHESTIEHGLNNFVEVGTALLDIKNRRLYRQTHSTFKDYVEEKWNMSVRRAYQLAECAATLKALPPTVQNFAQTESHVAELAKAPEVERANIVRLVQKKARSTGRKPTAKDIREASGMDEPAVIQRSKYPPGRNKLRVAKEWWYVRASAKGRGEFLAQWIFSSRKTVVVPSKAEFRKTIDRWMDDAVKESGE